MAHESQGADGVIAALGFEVHPGVLAADDVGALAKALADWPHRSRAGARHVLRHPAVAALANDARLVGIATSALAQRAIPFRATLFAKSAESNWLVTWHQDTALPLRARVDAPGWGPWSVKDGVSYAHAPARALEGVVALRVHLDDSDAGNGPLRVIPASHARGVLSDAEIQCLVAGSRPYACVCPRGGVIAMRPLLVHASSKSATTARRRVLHIDYASSAQVGAGLELAVA